MGQELQAEIEQSFLSEVRDQVRAAADELLAEAALKPGQILVVGCSTSEVTGRRIGTAGSRQVAEAILEPLYERTEASGIYLACQCCEHLNRALVLPEACAERYGLEQVSVIPAPTAGGAFASRALDYLPGGVVVEEVAAHAGLDIGSTLIGMHLKRVAVPIRLAIKYIGKAYVTAARTRPKLIGGERAVYRR